MSKDRIYSFDVFDTCLARLCGEPRLLFDVLSLKVKEAMGETCNEHLRQLFVASRVQAEGNNLHEIYSHVAQRFPLPGSVGQMAELELETEREMLVPIIATLELVNQLRKKGRILFISDMYLPSAFIRERLKKFGFFQEGDLLFVSDEIGAWKYDGLLYRYVHEKESIPYRHWHHFGDNRQSDFKEPRRLGIHAHHLHYDYLPYEEKWREIPVLQYQYSAILAGVARAVRISTEALDDQKAFVCDISAPLMVSWVLRIMKDAMQRGIRRLYFCARDVHSEFLIARQFQDVFPDIELRYLFISGPALYEDANCLDYLIQEGFADGIPVAIVDSCSSGKTLEAINKLLSSKGYSPSFGYFWEQMQVSSEPYVSSSLFAKYELQNAYLRSLASRRVRRFEGMRLLPELVFSLNYHKKTYGYEYHGQKLRPVFKDDEDDSWVFDGPSARIVKRNNDMILSRFSDSFKIVGLLPHVDSIFENNSTHILADFVDSPYKDYLHYLHRFVWWGSPLVGSIHGKNKGVWKRGNLFYSLPGLLTTPLRWVLSNAKLRRQLNQLLSWKSR